MTKLFACAISALAFAAASASADPYQLVYSGNSATTGAFTTTLDLNLPAGGGLATLLGGDRNGITVLSLSAYANANNSVQLPFPFVDFGGLSFTLADGISYNFYYSGTQLFELNSVLAPGGFPDGDAPISSATLTAVPEPATWGMMILGFGVLGAAMRRRSTKIAFA